MLREYLSSIPSERSTEPRGGWSMRPVSLPVQDPHRFLAMQDFLVVIAVAARIIVQSTVEYDMKSKLRSRFDVLIVLGAKRQHRCGCKGCLKTSCRNVKKRNQEKKRKRRKRMRDGE